MNDCCEKKREGVIPIKRNKGGELVYFVSKKGYGTISATCEDKVYTFKEKKPTQAPKSFSNARYLERVEEPAQESKKKFEPMNNFKEIDKKEPVKDIKKEIPQKEKDVKEEGYESI